MDNVKSVITLLQKDCFLASLDLKDAYLHVPVHLESQQFLRFAIHLQEEKSRSISIRKAMALLGLLSSVFPAVQWGQFHARNLQLWILRSWNRNISALERKILIPYGVKVSLNWWQELSHLSEGRMWFFSSTKNHNDGCQYVGVGRSHGLSTSTRAVVQGYGNKILQQQRTGSSMEKPSILQGSNQSVSCPDQVRQQQCSGLPESSGRNKKSSVVVSDSKDSALGREQLNIRQSSSFEGDLQCCGRLSQQVSDITRRMVSESRSICSDQPGMGHPCSRLIRKETKFKVSKVLLPVSKGQSVGNRRFLDRVAVEPDVCISPNTSDIKGSEQDYAGQSTSNSHSTFLAEKTVVCSVTEFSDVSTNNVTSQNRFVVAGPSSSPGLQASSPFSMEIEWGILKSKGFSDKLSETLIQSRKKVTRQIYQKTWKIYCEWCTRKEKDSRLSASALEFLQDGFQMGLSSSTLKVQTAALSVYLERRLAQEEFFLRFFQGIKRLRPVVISKVPPWDLNVVLQSLCEHPFEPLDQIPDKFLTLKTAFLLAITTARRVSELQALSIKPPYCTISEDRITLRPDFAFLPKVTSKFHRSQEIFLPSFCDKPTNEKERKLHCLDVRRCILHYLERTASWRRSDALLVLFAGKFKGRNSMNSMVATKFSMLLI
ncbi:uncharacterized protein [Hyperolius riggenbachi]|uniref:uncharacterized protein n=1 Tax=Hyperolius riggenbachi TaxID=752182 RepID=UPI0035A2D3C4